MSVLPPKGVRFIRKLCFLVVCCCTSPIVEVRKSPNFLDESEDGEADLHQCGACKEMFTSLSSYITHKIEKPCRESSRQQNHANKIETEAEEEMQQDKTCSENNKNLKARMI